MSRQRPTRREILRELREEVRGWRDLYKGADGIVRDVDVLRKIACLEAAIALIKGRP